MSLYHFPCSLLRWNLAVRQADINASAAIDEVRTDIPEDADHHYTEHEAQGKPRRHAEVRVDGAIEDKQQHESAQYNHAADTGQRHRGDAQDSVAARRFPDVAQTIGEEDARNRDQDEGGNL